MSTYAYTHMHTTYAMKKRNKISVTPFLHDILLQDVKTAPILYIMSFTHMLPRIKVFVQIVLRCANALRDVRALKG